MRLDTLRLSQPYSDAALMADRQQEGSRGGVRAAAAESSARGHTHRSRLYIWMYVDAGSGMRAEW